MRRRDDRTDEAAVTDALNAANHSEAWAKKRVFTTGEAASVCRLSQQTIIRCFDDGKLKGFRVPGSKFRRIPRESLIAFMQTHDIPVEQLDSGTKKVLIVDDDAAIVEMLEDVLQRDGRFEVKSATNGFDAGSQTQAFRPDILLLDFMLPDINGNIVCERIRQDASLAKTRIIIVSGAVDPNEIERLMSAGADDFVKKPFDIDKLIARMVELLAT